MLNKRDIVLNNQLLKIGCCSKGNTAILRQYYDLIDKYYRRKEKK